MVDEFPEKLSSPESVMLGCEWSKPLILRLETQPSFREGSLNDESKSPIKILDKYLRLNGKRETGK